VVVPIKDVGLPLAHAVGAIMSTTSASATATSGISATGDQVTGVPRITVTQDQQRERAQAGDS
jgi:hypothetical protein